jgi:hypothetical protein
MQHIHIPNGVKSFFFFYVFKSKNLMDWVGAKICSTHIPLAILNHISILKGIIQLVKS